MNTQSIKTITSKFSPFRRKVLVILVLGSQALGCNFPSQRTPLPPTTTATRTPANSTPTGLPLTRTPPSATEPVSTPTEEPNFTLQRQLAQVFFGNAQPLNEVQDDLPQPFPEGFFASTNLTGEALIQGNLEGRTCQIFLFFTSRLQKRACERSSVTSGNASCVEEGSAVFNQCSDMFVMTPSGQAQLSGTWVSTTYIAGKQVSLFIVTEGEITVLPVNQMRTYALGKPAAVTAGQFYYTIPDRNRNGVPGLEPQQVYPISRLPALVQFYDIQGWMEQAYQTSLFTETQFPSPETLQGPPDLVAEIFPSKLTAEDRRTAVAGANFMLIPIDIVLTNLGGQPAEDFKITLSAKSTDGDFARPIFIAGEPVSGYAYTQNPLLPGEQITIHGLIGFPTTLNGQTATMYAEADSCFGEEFSPPECRIKETDEKNNFSPPVDIQVVPYQ